MSSLWAVFLPKKNEQINRYDNQNFEQPGTKKKNPEQAELNPSKNPKVRSSARLPFT